MLLFGVSLFFLTSGSAINMMNSSVMIEWDFMFSYGGVMSFVLYLDWMSSFFFSFVALISGSIFLYSGSYMATDKNKKCFLFLVFMFVLSMFFMVFSLNLISLMLGWDGLGIISYILVVYYLNEKSSAAGMITALSNRIGDAALLLSIACLAELSSWNFLLINESINLKQLNILIMLAAITKSAQIPFSAWLPAAMAAPTPVSALVHSSTLVTAGVYLLIRFSEFLKNFTYFSLFVYLGMLTTLMASISALYEPDLKKVVALSTLSQLGIMVSTLALGFAELAFFHLLTHAMFKAMLFMCSGKVIHSLGGSQDLRSSGGMFFNLPITGVVMNTSNFALMGVPFLSGFYSKDLLIEMSISKDLFFFKYIIYMLMVGLSASYSFRLTYFSMMVNTKQTKVSDSEEEDWMMLLSKSGLLLMTIVSGAFLMWIFASTPYSVSLIWYLKILAFMSMSGGFMIGILLCFYKTLWSFFSNNLFVYKSSMVMWNLPSLSGASIVKENFLVMNFKVFELKWLELMGGQGMYFWWSGHASLTKEWQVNMVKKFLMVFFLGVLIYLVFM